MALLSVVIVQLPWRLHVMQTRRASVYEGLPTKEGIKSYFLIVFICGIKNTVKTLKIAGVNSLFTRY
jgi:hypothetical protein